MSRNSELQRNLAKALGENERLMAEVLELRVKLESCENELAFKSAQVSRLREQLTAGIFPSAEQMHQNVMAFMTKIRELSDGR